MGVYQRIRFTIHVLCVIITVQNVQQHLLPSAADFDVRRMPRPASESHVEVPRWLQSKGAKGAQTEGGGHFAWEASGDGACHTDLSGRNWSTFELKPTRPVFIVHSSSGQPSCRLSETLTSVSSEWIYGVLAHSLRRLESFCTPSFQGTFEAWF